MQFLNTPRVSPLHILLYTELRTELRRFERRRVDVLTVSANNFSPPSKRQNSVPMR